MQLAELPNWSGAHCLGKDPEGFFPRRGTAQVTARAAKLVCNGDGEDQKECPRRVQCLEYALERKERDGIWGGMSEKQRSTLARRRRQDAADRELELTQPPVTVTTAVDAVGRRRKARITERAAAAATRSKETSSAQSRVIVRVTYAA